MRNKLFIGFVAIALVASSCQNPAGEWKIAGNHITTEWGEKLDPENVLQEYPRPQMTRERWMNLNGLWNYEVLPVEATAARLSGKILVPFAIESALSGVGENLLPGETLHYTKEFKLPRSWKGEHVLLHFGAVDCHTKVLVNGAEVVRHDGGYAPFSADITSALVKGANTLEVLVQDSTDKDYWAVGKQTLKPRSIWYTAVSGIWQTVWMEPVPESHIEKVVITPDLASGSICLNVPTSDGKGLVTAQLFDGNTLVASAIASVGEDFCLKVAEPKLWSPENPFLYDLKLTLDSGDSVQSYAAMRSYGVGPKDKDGFHRFQLNGKDYFLMAPLDQGWWPDGLYTAPSDEALAFDIEKTKELGFNSIRKHIKVEPARWYYHCDRLGIIVWQDMPSGFIDTKNKKYWIGRYDYITDEPIERHAESMQAYYHEWGEIIDALYSYPCIGMWVPYNEGWGQWQTPEVAAWTAAKDPTRPVNAASGGNFLPGAGDIVDMHHYPQPKVILIDPDRVNVLGEYGGIGLSVEGHLWKEVEGKAKGGNWGYIQGEGIKEVTDRYVEYAGMLLGMVPQGYSSAVYTQTTDVEIEVNGLMTYDRKVIKVDAERVAAANRSLCQSLE